MTPKLTIHKLIKGRPGLVRSARLSHGAMSANWVEVGYDASMQS